MKFPRTTKLFRGQFDLAPFLCVIFVLLFFMLFGSFLVLPRGTRLELPAGDEAAGGWTGRGSLIVAIDANEQLYFENQIMPGREDLVRRLQARTSGVGGARRLFLQADRRVRYERLMEVADLARRAGVEEVILSGQSARKP
jgi:biopolymer transport protein ExbD